MKKLILSTVMISLLLATMALATYENLILNPSFEDTRINDSELPLHWYWGADWNDNEDIGSWNKSLIKISNDSHSGNNAMEIIEPSGDIDIKSQTIFEDFTSGTEFSFTFYTKTETGALYINVAFWNETGLNDEFHAEVDKNGIYKILWGWPGMEIISNSSEIDGDWIKNQIDFRITRYSDRVAIWFGSHYWGIHYPGSILIDDISLPFNKEKINADVNIDPDTLNLRSNGKWITAYIEIPGDETAYASVYLECGEVGSEGFITMFDIEVGESKKPGCGTLTLLEARENYTRFEMSILEWKWEFTLSEGESKRIDWNNHWVTVKLLDVFPGSGGSMDIDVNTVKLEYEGKTVNAENNPKYGFVSNPESHDSDNDGIPEFMVKFNREEVKRIVKTGSITLTVSGMAGNSYFEGSDTIRVIGKTVMVGDSIKRDIIPAKKLSMTTVLARYGSEESGKADYEINDIKELLDIVNRIILV